MNPIVLTPQEALQQLYNLASQLKLTLAEHNQVKELALTVSNALPVLGMVREEVPEVGSLEEEKSEE